MNTIEQYLKSESSNNPGQSVIQTKGATYPKYSEYKESGVEWLGKLPSEWRLLSNKYVLKLKKNLVGKNSGNYVLLSLTLKGIIKRVLEDGGKFPAEYDTYQEVKKGDLVFCLFDVEETPRCVGLSDYDGMITGAYTVMDVNANFDKRYLYYIYLNLDSDKRMRPLYTGLRNTISKDNFFSFKTFVPSHSEQTAIAKFLDDKTAKIDQAIAQKEKLIALLKERKQIIIQNAVTKGLDPNVKLKDSGVEWIGDIPVGWEVKKLKNIIKDLESGVSVNASESEVANDNEIGVLKTSAVYSYSFDKLANKKVFKSELNRVRCPVKKGQIIISRMNAPELVGASGYVHDSYPNLFLPDRLWQTKYHSNIKFDSFWLSIVLTTISIRNVITSLANGSSPSMKNISKPDFLNIIIPFPSFKEQMIIANNIKIQSAKIDQAIDLQEEQIQKLKELKSTLIDSAVTGKIKVS